MSVARGSTNPLILLLVPVAWRAQLVERAKKKKLHVLLQQTTVFAMSVARGSTNPLILLLVPVAWCVLLVAPARNKRLSVRLQRMSMYAVILNAHVLVEEEQLEYSVQQMVVQYVLPVTKRDIFKLPVTKRVANHGQYAMHSPSMNLHPQQQQ